MEFTSSPPLTPSVQRRRRDEVEMEETAYVEGDSQGRKRQRLEDEDGDDGEESEVCMIR